MFASRIAVRYDQADQAIATMADTSLPTALAPPHSVYPFPFFPTHHTA